VYNNAPSGSSFCNGYPPNDGSHRSLWLAVKPGRGQLVLNNNAGANSNFDVMTVLWEATTGTFPADPNSLSEKDAVLSGATEQDNPITYYTQANHYYAIEYVQCTLGATVSMTSNLTFVPSPANDDMYSAKAGASTATVISGSGPLGQGGYAVAGDNVGATAGTYDPQSDYTYVYYDDPNDSQTYGYVRHNLWWSWLPTTTGQVTISTAGSALDTGIVLYSTTGSPTSISALTEIARNDNVSALNKTSVITVHVTAGTQYVLMLDGAPNGDHSDTATGSFNLNVSEIAAPANDLYANAQALPATNTGSVPGTTVGAGTETNDPSTYYGAATTVWYSFKAPATATYEFDTLATQGSPSAVPDTIIGVGAKGATLSNVNLNDTNDNATQDTVLSRVVSQLTKDTTYVIEVDGHNNNVNPITGPFVLSWSIVDSTPPTTTITAPAADQVVTLGTSTLPVSATVTDATGVASVQISVDNQTNWVNATHGSGNTWTGSVDISALQVGQHTVYVESTDTAFDANHATSSVTFTVGTVPTAPTGLTVTPGNTTVKVGWTAPSGNFGAVITGYTVTASPGGKSCHTAASTLSCTVTGLTDGTPYTFSVVATNGVGDSLAATINGTPVPLGPPTKIKGVAGAKAGTATITFVAPKGGKAIDYILQIKVKGKWTTYKDGKSAATKIAVKGLKAKTVYTAHLTAVPSVGKATTSASFTFKTK
jgi:hypothetical protein